MKRIILLLLIIIINSSFATSVNRNYGLKFHSYEVVGKDRTGLTLENNENIPVNQNFELNFDLEVRNETLFGSVVRIINESGNSIILSLGPNDKEVAIPKLLISNVISPLNEKIIFNKWFPVKILISNTDHTISLYYNNSYHLIRNIKNDWKNVKICFGSSSLTNFTTEEVPPINLREIKLLNDNKLIRYWKLNKHDVTECYDEIKNAKAIATNPEWLLDKYTKWRKILTLDFDNTNYTQYAFDAKNGIIYIVPDEKTIIAYNPATNTQKKIEVLGGMPASRSTNQLIFDPQKKQLISYNLEEQFLSVFSFETGRWSNNRMSKQENRFWHHTADFRLSDSSIMTFGGYGMYLYKNDIFRISTTNQPWKTTQLNSIPKRYSASSVIVNDTLFIFSGGGNKMGKQELPSTIYTDLYAIDLKTLHVSLVWKTSSKELDLPGGNMIYNQPENCFYVLTSKFGGSLMKISKTEPEVELITTNKTQLLEADFNFYTLLKPENDTKIYALYCRDYKLGNSKLDIYEILYPPFSINNELQVLPSKPGVGILIVLLFFVLLIIALLGYRYLKTKSRIKTEPSVKIIPVESEFQDDQTTDEMIENIYFNRSRKSISLLGAFNVKDMEGKDITNQFTPILKTIIIAVILYNNNDGGGVNSNVIDDLIWPDKDKKSARNNRNVSINRLNNVLEQVGDIHIYSDSNFWKIEIRDDSFIDYFSVSKLMKLPEHEILKSRDITSQLIELLSFGQLLPFTQLEWIDTYKASYSNFSLDFLSSMLEKDEVKNNIKMKLHVANIISLFDSVNENALSIKCNILYVMGKKGLAKFTYTNFCKEYESLLGEKYPLSFASIIELNVKPNN